MIQATRDLALEAVRVTEAAAMAAARFMGGGDEKAADEAAVDAMHTALRALPIAGTIRIGEDDGAAKLYRGEPVGDGEGAKADVAVLPLEGATIIARGGPNALSVIVIAEDGGFVDVPATYMDKIAVGSGLPLGVVDLDEEPAANLEALAGAKGVEVADLVTCILDRPRHAELIAKVRAAGARIRLILDGDVSAALATCREGGVDVSLGVGGAAEGVLAASAQRCMGGQMQGRFVLRTDEEKARAAALGIDDVGRKYAADEMVQGHVTVAATGVTTGLLLAGVRRLDGVVVTQSLVMGSRTGTLRFIESHHGLCGWPRMGGT